MAAPSKSLRIGTRRPATPLVKPHEFISVWLIRLPRSVSTITANFIIRKTGILNACNAAMRNHPMSLAFSDCPTKAVWERSAAIELHGRPHLFETRLVNYFSGHKGVIPSGQIPHAGENSIMRRKLNLSNTPDVKQSDHSSMCILPHGFSKRSIDQEPTLMTFPIFQRTGRPKSYGIFVRSLSR